MCSPLVTPMANVLRGDAPAEAPPFSFARPPPPPPRLPTANDLKLSLSLQQVFGIDNMLMQHGFKTVIAVADDGVQPGPVRRHISVDRRRPHGDN